MHVITIFYIHMSLKQHVFLGPTNHTFRCLCSIFFPKTPNPGRISFLRQSWRKKSIDSRRTRWDLRKIIFLGNPAIIYLINSVDTTFCFLPCAHDLKNAEKSEPLASTTLAPSIARESNWRVATCSTDPVVQPAGHTKSSAASLPRKKRPRCVVGWSWIQLQDFAQGIAKLRRIRYTLHFECPILREITTHQKFPQKRCIQDVATIPGITSLTLLQGYISCATGWANGDQGTSVGHVGEWSFDHFCTSFYDDINIILRYDRMRSTM